MHIVPRWIWFIVSFLKLDLIHIIIWIQKSRYNRVRKISRFWAAEQLKAAHKQYDTLTGSTIFP